MASTLLTVGKVIGVHGTKGEVKILSLTDFPTRFKMGLSLYVHSSLLETDELKIEWVKNTSKNIIIKFGGIESRKDAEKLKGSLLQISNKKAHSLPKDAYWQHEIIGLKVITSSKELVGYVTEIMRTGSNDVYVVNWEGKKESLIPAIKDVVKKIDLKNKLMVIEPIKGLLE